MQKMLSADRSLSVANAVCIREDFVPTVHPDYKDLLSRIYDAELFASADLYKDVNAWIKTKTNGLISEMPPETFRDVLMCLISAVAFESAWACPYEDVDVRDRYFCNMDGSTSRVWMLYGTEDEYIENSDFVGFMKSYQDSNLSFMALLPKVKGEAAMMKALDRIDFAELFHSVSYAVVHTKMPEFRVEYEQELSDLCKAFGIQELFTDDADFSPMSAERLKIDSILLKAFIDVNQEGTRAAAVTLGCVVVGCCPPREFKEVHLDRPFVFAIVDQNAHIPVFSGVVTHLEDAKVNPERLKRKLRRGRGLWTK